MGGKFMQKIIRIVSIILVVLFVAVSVTGEHSSWDCPDCGRTGNTGNYCGGCAHPAPWIEEDKFAIGNYVTFGHYPQTKDGNDSTPIEWLVLDRDGQKALLISRFGLDVRLYNNDTQSYYTGQGNDWRKSTLRAWLNGIFKHKAFSAAEQSAILVTNVDNNSSQGYDSWNPKDKNSTQDRIFLLSYAEVKQYFNVTFDSTSNVESRVTPTAYALKAGAWVHNDNKTADGAKAGWWWLRSPGLGQNSAAGVSSSGSLSTRNVFVDTVCIRPALWINLESDIF